MSSPTATAIWHLRSLISPRSRRIIRRLSDPWIVPVGSIVGARTGDPVFALTFDDGPERGATSAVLDVLAGHGAKATFFVLLDKAEAEPELLRRMLSEGHEIGLHGVDHRRLTRMSGSDAREHIRSGVRRFQALAGFPPKWFRPPYGSQNLRTYFAARRSGMDVVGWSADCADWTDRPASALAELALAGLRPGGILLIHDALASDPDEALSLPAIDRPMLVDLILKGMKERGYTAMSMTDLLRERRAHHTAWFRP